MKKNILFLLTIAVLFSCSTAKYADGFMSKKKFIESYTIYKPYVDVYYGASNNSTYLPEISDSIAQFLVDKTKLVLDEKYTLEENIEGLPIDPTTDAQIRFLLDEIITSNKSLNHIKLPPVFKAISDKSKTRYGIMFFLSGNYNPGSSIMVYASFKGIPIPVYSAHHDGTDITMIVIDKQTNEVTYSNSARYRDMDPRSKSNIERITMEALKAIYYK